MTHEELAKSLKERFTNRITSESSEEEIKEVNESVALVNDLEENYNNLVKENAKLKDTIVRMVSSQGSAEQPKDASSESKPKSIDEIISEKLKEKEGK